MEADQAWTEFSFRPLIAARAGGRLDGPAVAGDETTENRGPDQTIDNDPSRTRHERPARCGVSCRES